MAPLVWLLPFELGTDRRVLRESAIVGAFEYSDWIEHILSDLSTANLRPHVEHVAR